MHRVLSKALEDAVKDELIHKNPAKLVTPPPKNKYEASFLTVKEIREMLKKFKDDEMFIPVLLSVLPGLRRGEVLGLQWKDIDFDNRLIRIRNNYVMVDGNPVLQGKTKTDKSSRNIVVAERIINSLKDHQHAQKKMRVRLGKDYFKSDFVCTWMDGKPFNPSHVSRAFSARMKTYSLPMIRFHDLRHSNASLMLSQNAPMKGASDRLGHSTIQITSDLYGHAERSVQEQIANMIDNVIWG
ncbi:MAG: site-specific integrase [Bacillota bacterium]